MSDPPSYLDTLHLKIKTKINEHIDNASQNIKLNTNLNDDSKKKNGDSVKQSKPVDNTPWPLIFLRNYIIGLLIVLPIFSINASIRFIIKEAKETMYPRTHPQQPAPKFSKSVLDIWFPSNCKEYPYGNETIDPCGDCAIKWFGKCLTAKKLEQINENIENVEVQHKGGGGRRSRKMSGGRDAVGVPAKDIGWLQQMIDRVVFGPTFSKNPEFPYNFYKDENLEEDKSKCGPSAWGGGIFRSYFNWIIRALALTNTGLYGNFKDLIGKLKNIPDILMLFFGSLLLVVIPCIFVYSLCGNILNHWTGVINLFEKVFSEGNIWVIFLILLTSITGINFGLDIIFALWAAFFTLIKIIIYPILTYPTKVKAGLIDMAPIIGFIIGGVWLIALLTTPLDRGIGADAAKVTKIITAIFYGIIVIIGILWKIYKWWKPSLKLLYIAEPSQRKRHSASSTVSTAINNPDINHFYINAAQERQQRQQRGGD